jgi:hypothetical protein
MCDARCTLGSTLQQQQHHQPYKQQQQLSWLCHSTLLRLHGVWCLQVTFHMPMDTL